MAGTQKTPQRHSKIHVTEELRLGEHAVLVIKQSDGTVTTLDLTELVGLDDISATELGFLDGVTAGTGAVSKALVLDANGEVTMPDGGEIHLSADTLAAAGSSSSDAAALTDQITVVTGADGAKGVVLPAAADLKEYLVINDSPVYAVKVYPVDSGDDVINELQSDEAFILGPGQSARFKAISATQWYANKAASEPRVETHFEVFDDFTDASIDTTNNWIVFAGGDANATAAAVTTAPEGKVDMGSGDGGSTADGSVLSLILLAKGSLVSLGKTVFEARVSFDQLTGMQANIGLSDTLATADEHLLHTVDSDTVADGGLTVTDAVEFAYSSDADSQAWQAVSENGGTIGNSANEDPLTSSPSADTYDTLRIEVDASGDARFYVNGVLEGTRATAVATTALLIPYIGIDAGTDAQADTVLSIDYIKFQGARPASNA